MSEDTVPAAPESGEEKLPDLPPLVIADSALMPALIARSRRIRLEFLGLYYALGGQKTALEWAKNNLGEYYKLTFGKAMPKEVEHTQAGTLEDYLDQLEDVKQRGEIIDASPVKSSERSSSGSSS